MGSENGDYMRGTMKDGAPITIQWFDRGKKLFADPEGVSWVFETVFLIAGREVTSRTDYEMLKKAHRGLRPRHEQDRQFLEDAGIDTSSLERVSAFGSVSPAFETSECF